MDKKGASLLAAGIIMISAATIVFVFYNKKVSAPSESDGKTTVTASFYPLYFLAREIGGDKADVKDITPSGAEPHDYEPTAQDIARIEKSRLLIINGGGMEAWADSIRQNINPERTSIVVAGEGLDTRKLAGEGKTAADSHVWLSPVLAGRMADKIAQGLSAADPANKDYYFANLSALRSKLDDLDQEYRKGLENCERKDIITSHAAFGYLAAEYGLNQVPIAGLSPDVEPSPQEIARIVKFAKENNIKYIFFESLVSPKLAQTIAAEAGVETLVLNPIEGLSDEDLAQGKTYFTEMENNLTNLKIALQCR